MTNDSYVHNLFDLIDRVAIITGGAGMLGLKYGEAIAEMGGIPVLVDLHADRCRDAEQHIRQMFGGEALGAQADITAGDQVQAMVDDVVARFGRIDILINNAALTVKGGGAAFDDYFAPFEEYPRNLFDLALQVNLTGAFLVTQAVGRVMVGQRRGVIVNISSDVAMISPDHRIYQGMTAGYDGKPFNTPIAYSMSKAALLAFTRYLATYWADKGIRVNALSPAGVYDDHDPAFVQRFSSVVPLGRMAHKDEYKGAIIFLVSDASSFMTGSNLIVDGGRTAW
ncbi:MAG: SDR family oxidoreductase [Chloroflexi bacterium]|nr:SDR family oxidoreductase [Chloroflexota bacterium]